MEADKLLGHIDGGLVVRVEITRLDRKPHSFHAARNHIELLFVVGNDSVFHELHSVFRFGCKALAVNDIIEILKKNPGRKVTELLFGDGFLTIQIIVIHGFNARYIFIDPKDAF